jgi:hypothetical protein
MIYIPVQGGLGNQLFQWSMAHYITQETGLPVTLVQNPSAAHSINQNPLLQLSNQCTHRIKVVLNPKIALGYRVIDKLSKYDSMQISKVSEKIKMFTLSDAESAILPAATSKNSSIRGFFQSTTMVKQVWSDLKREIQTVIESSLENAGKTVDETFLDLNHSYEAFHIRRGDYLENKDHLGVLSVDYFEKLITPNQSVVVCSDSLKSEELDQWRMEYRLYNQDKLSAIETLAVLSNGKRLIMSNSTLSWWASQFVLDKGGQVVAPTPWFKRSDLVSDKYLFDERFTYADSNFL